MQGGDNPPSITVADIGTAADNTAAVPSDAVVSSGAYQEAFVRLSEENESLKQELDATKKTVRTIQILDELIEPYAKKSFWFMCAYCGTVGAILLTDGCQSSGFKLPESVLRFLVGSTATTVIGLVGMVLTGIFVGARRRNDP